MNYSNLQILPTIIVGFMNPFLWLTFVSIILGGVGIGYTLSNFYSRINRNPVLRYFGFVRSEDEILGFRDTFKGFYNTLALKSSRFFNYDLKPSKLYLDTRVSPSFGFTRGDYVDPYQLSACNYLRVGVDGVVRGFRRGILFTTIVSGNSVSRLTIPRAFHVEREPRSTAWLSWSLSPLEFINKYQWLLAGFGVMSYLIMRRLRRGRLNYESLQSQSFKMVDICVVFLASYAFVRHGKDNVIRVVMPFLTMSRVAIHFVNGALLLSGGGKRYGHRFIKYLESKMKSTNPIQPRELYYSVYNYRTTYGHDEWRSLDRWKSYSEIVRREGGNEASHYLIGLIDAIDVASNDPLPDLSERENPDVPNGWRYPGFHRGDFRLIVDNSPIEVGTRAMVNIVDNVIGNDEESAIADLSNIDIDDDLSDEVERGFFSSTWRSIREGADSTVICLFCLLFGFAMFLVYEFFAPESYWNKKDLVETQSTDDLHLEGCTFSTISVDTIQVSPSSPTLESIAKMHGELKGDDFSSPTPNIVVLPIVESGDSNENSHLGELSVESLRDEFNHNVVKDVVSEMVNAVADNVSYMAQFPIPCGLSEYPLVRENFVEPGKVDSSTSTDDFELTILKNIDVSSGLVDVESKRDESISYEILKRPGNINYEGTNRRKKKNWIKYDKDTKPDEYRDILDTHNISKGRKKRLTYADFTESMRNDLEAEATAQAVARLASKGVNESDKYYRDELYHMKDDILDELIDEAIADYDKAIGFKGESATGTYITKDEFNSCFDKFRNDLYEMQKDTIGKLVDTLDKKKKSVLAKNVVENLDVYPSEDKIGTKRVTFEKVNNRVRPKSERKRCPTCHWFLVPNKSHVCNDCFDCGKGLLLQKDKGFMVMSDHECGPKVIRKYGKIVKGVIKHESVLPNRPIFKVGSNLRNIVLEGDGKYLCHVTQVGSYGIFPHHSLQGTSKETKFRMLTSKGSVDINNNEIHLLPDKFEGAPLFKYDRWCIVPKVKLPACSGYNIAKKVLIGPCMKYSYPLEEMDKNGHENVTEDKLRASPGNVSSLADQEYKMSSVDGDCGSPVYDENGNVFGTHVGNMGEKINLYENISLSNVHLWKLLNSKELKNVRGQLF